MRSEENLDSIKYMIKTTLVLISGVIFGIGLTLSSMTKPDKVIGFLDIFYSWDPS